MTSILCRIGLHLLKQPYGYEYWEDVKFITSNSKKFEVIQRVQPWICTGCGLLGRWDLHETKVHEK